jgi:hypothetical protein
MFIDQSLVISHGKSYQLALVSVDIMCKYYDSILGQAYKDDSVLGY